MSLVNLIGSLYRRVQSQYAAHIYIILCVISFARFLAHKLEQSAHRATRHALAISVRLVATASHYAGHIHVNPWLILCYELAQKCSSRARPTATAFAQVVEVVALKVGHLLAVELEERHSPDTIATFRAGGVQMLPKTSVVGEGTGHTGAEGIL